MSPPVFGTPIFSDVGVVQTPTLTGGSWLSTLPLTNLQDRRLAKVARSTNALAASTTFDVDLGVARAVGLLAVLIPNLTKSSVPTVRWLGSTVANFATTVYDSGAVAAWPSTATAEDVGTMHVWTPTIPPAAQAARYWRCAIVDTANVNGYIDVARVVIAGAYTPSYGMDVGGKTFLETDTIRTVTDGGAAVYQDKPRRRGETFVISNLTQAETFANVRKMQRQLGTAGQLFFVFDPTDTTLMYERAYLCVLKQLDALDYPWGTAMNAAFSLVEEL
jgi:hypothetical protein